MVTKDEQDARFLHMKEEIKEQEEKLRKQRLEKVGPQQSKSPEAL